MIDLAAYTTNGVKLLGQKSMQVELKWTCKDHLTKLKVQMIVRIYYYTNFLSPHVV